MKVVSRIYSNQKLAIFGEVIEFKNGVAEISNDLFKKIVESKFPNIFKEGEAPQQKNADQIDTDKTIEVLKEEYNSEIDRLKNIITTKDKQIKDLKDEVKTWKKAVENLKKQLPAVVKEAPSNEKKLEENAYNSSIYIAVDTLEYLKKGGRVTAAGAAIGAVLNIKPVLTIQGEKLDAFTKVRGMKKAELKMLEAIEEDLNTRFADVDRKQLRLGAAGTFQKQEDADQWYNMVKDTFENEIDDIYYDSLSFSIGCHVGPNAIGIGISVVTRDEK